MNGQKQKQKIKHFDCYGREEDCLKCPLPDCIRSMCVVDGEEITVSIKRNIAEYHRQLYREKRKEYFREYYKKNRDKYLQHAREQTIRRRQKNRGLKMYIDNQIKRLKARKEEELNLFIGKMEAINDEIKFWKREAKRQSRQWDELDIVQKEEEKPLLREKDCYENKYEG